MGDQRPPLGPDWKCRVSEGLTQTEDLDVSKAGGRENGRLLSFVVRGPRQGKLVYAVVGTGKVVDGKNEEEG